MRVSFRINGDPVMVDVEPRLHLADCLRDVLGLTGTHLGCEHGACGACTVILDGAAVRACLMLTVQAEGASVVTIEGVPSDEALSPLQTAFRKHHALQCGFCTPGMLTTAHALLPEEPDADADRVRSVLSGNLFRCTGYPDRPSGARSEHNLPEGGQTMIGTNRYIGSPVERIEDPRFLHGRGQFVGDLKREGMLHAAILRSPVAHGHVAAVNASAALAIAGVRAVITAKAIGIVPPIPLRLLPMAGTEPSCSQ